MSLTGRALAWLLAGAVVLAAPAGAAAAKLEYDLVPVKVADGVWMIEGATEHFSTENGGAIANTVLIETDSGVVVVDSGPSLRFGETLRAAARKISARGVAAVINTHHHPDHFFGNQAFSDKPIYALGETSKQAAGLGDAFSDNMYRLIGDWMRGTEPVPPNKVLDGSSLTIGGRTLRVLALTGHTEADLALVDVKTETLIAGDLVFLNRTPTTPHADLEKWRESLDFLKSLEPAAIIPGHGPVDRTGASLRQTRDYLDWLEQTLEAAASQGLDMVEIMQAKLPERFATMGAMPEEFHRSVVHLYPAIERAKLPLSD